jgi:hypothetical protein
MELALNLVWLLAAASFVFIWRLEWTSQERHTPREQLAELTALSCVLVSLFFSISLTDDLHPTTILSEEERLKSHSLVWERWHFSHRHADQRRASSVTALPQALPFARLSLEDVLSPVTVQVAEILNGNSLFSCGPPPSFRFARLC